MPWYIWLFLILGIATAGAFVIMWYRKKINKDMNK
jgi:Na+-driven multidrug efflux pump